MKFDAPCWYSSFEDGDLTCDRTDVNHRHSEVTIQKLQEMVQEKQKRNVREFLEPQEDGTYDYVEWTCLTCPPEDYVGIPEGATTATYYKPTDSIYFWKGEESSFHIDGWVDCKVAKIMPSSKFLAEDGTKLVWERHPQEQALISGDVALANVHKLIVQYKHDDEPYDRWTTITNHLWSQYDLGMFLDLDTKFKFRFKPRMFNLNGDDVPAPLIEYPLVKTPYFYLRPDWEKGYCLTTWEDIPIDKKRFSNGIWPTESAIRQVVAAFRKTIQVL
ncbi:hypothetical protein J9896_08680 [Acinetobacter baumannii]|uniref:hypothetical protein n=1 Tax=Acinetobacter baumannii TaxID=470 RepID=UPI001B31C8DB|nr:hypothetical protein [Acinetobacter baumannii]MBP4063474.1 hypothetical protein [Acinetobacter baumannii]